MLKRNITYKDFDGKIQTEEFYFNLTEVELIEAEVEGDGASLKASLERIVKAEDRAGLIREFKKIILSSVGLKSEDGKRFVKNPEIREDFRNSAAFNALFLELATNEQAGALFIKGIMPDDMLAALNEHLDQDKPKGPPRLVKPPMPPKQ